MADSGWFAEHVRAREAERFEARRAIYSDMRRQEVERAELAIDRANQAREGAKS